MPLEQLDQPLQAGAQVARGIVGPLDIERRLDEQLVAALQPAGERRQDRHAGRACQPHRAGRQGCLLAEEDHRPAVLEEVAVGGEPDQLAPAQCQDDAPDTARCCPLDAQSAAGPQIVHRGVEEFRNRTGRQRGEPVSPGREELPHVVEGAEVSRYDDGALARGSQALELGPALGADLDRADQLVWREVRHAQEVDEVPSAVPEDATRYVPHLLSAGTGAEGQSHVVLDVPAVRLQEQVGKVAAAVGQPVGQRQRHQPDDLAHQPGQPLAEPTDPASIARDNSAAHATPHIEIG